MCVCVCVCVCVCSNVPLVYLKLHIVHEITVPYMAPLLGATISSKKLSNKKKKVSILQCIWNGESIDIWNQFFFFLKKTLNWTHNKN